MDLETLSLPPHVTVAEVDGALDVYAEGRVIGRVAEAAASARASAHFAAATTDRRGRRRDAAFPGLQAAVNFILNPQAAR